MGLNPCREEIQCLVEKTEPVLSPKPAMRAGVVYGLSQRLQSQLPPASSLEWVKSLQRVNPWLCGKAGRAVNPPFLGAKGVKSLRRGKPRQSFPQNLRLARSLGR